MRFTMSIARRSKVIEASSVRNAAWAASVTFSWNLTTDSGTGVASYRLQADSAGTFVSVVETTVSAVTSSAPLSLPAPG